MSTNDNSLKKIKIFYFAPDFYPAWRLDLSELFSVELAKREIEVTWSLWRNEPGRAGWVEQYGQQAYVPLFYKENSILLRMLNKFFQLMSDFRLFFHLLFGSHYDIIQARDLRYLSAGLGLLVARLRGSKFTCWLSYPFPEHESEKAVDKHGVKSVFHRFRGALSGYWLYRFIYPKADHIFVQSKQMKTDLHQSYNVPLEKMTPVPMGVPKSLLDWTAEHPSKVIPGQIVYVGTFAKVRKLELLIDTFVLVKKQIPNAELWLVGEGDVPEERKMLEQQVKILQLSDSVHFTGFVSMDEVWKISASSEVCLSPFYPTFVLRSASPTKLNEYMALGRPCVANDHPEQASTLKASGAGLCVAWGAKNFADAIIWILNHPEKAQKMSQQGPVWVKANRTYDRIADQVYDQYLKILSQK